MRGTNGNKNGVPASDSASSQTDLSALRKPMATSVTGFADVVEAYVQGTSEFRQRLAEECDLLYECKVCRTMFRCVANFLTHKRVYCRSLFNEMEHFHFPYSPHDIKTQMQVDESNIREVQLTGNGFGQRQQSGPKDLGGVVERLLSKQHLAGTLKMSDYYEQVHSKVTMDDIMRRKQVIHLDAIDSSSVAKYQTVQMDANHIEVASTDMMKQQVNEVAKLLANDRVMMDADGKACQMTEAQAKRARDNEGSCDTIIDIENIDLLCHVNDEGEQIGDRDSGGAVVPAARHQCGICDDRFETEKTLRLHIQRRHITSTKVFQCPSCSKTFLQPALVISHLSNVHKKSTKKVRSMRDSIYKREMRLDEVLVKGPNRELSRLQAMEKERAAEEEARKAYLDNVANLDNANQSMCTYCNKVFDRKAVLTSHIANCPKYKKPKTNGTTTATATAVSKQGSAGTRRSLKSSHNEKDVVTTAATATITATASATSPAATASGTEDNGKESQLAQDENTSSTELSFEDAPPSLATNGSTLVDEPIRMAGDTVSGPDLNLNADHSSESNHSMAKLKRKRKLAEQVPGDLKRQRKVDQMDAELASMCDNNVSMDVDDENYFSLDETHTVTGSKNSWLCNICSKSFRTRSNLKQHSSMMHYFKNRFKCKLCSFSALKKQDIIVHLIEVHELEAHSYDLKEYIVAAQEKNDTSSAEVLELDIGDENLSSSTPAKLLEDVCDDSASNSSMLGTARNISPSSDISTSSTSNNLTLAIPTAPPKRRGRPKGSFKVRPSSSPLPGPCPPPALISSDLVVKPIRIQFTEGENDKMSKSSSGSSSPIPGEISATSKRPFRNRTKPKDKDFVYDLSLLKNNFDYKDFCEYEATMAEAALQTNTSSSSSSSNAPGTGSGGPIKKRTNSVDKLVVGPSSTYKRPVGRPSIKVKLSKSDVRDVVNGPEVAMNPEPDLNCAYSVNAVAPKEVVLQRNPVERVMPTVDKNEPHLYNDQQYLCNNQLHLYEREQQLNTILAKEKGETIRKYALIMGIDCDTVMVDENTAQISSPHGLGSTAKPNGDSESAKTTKSEIDTNCQLSKNRHYGDDKL